MADEHEAELDQDPTEDEAEDVGTEDEDSGESSSEEDDGGEAAEEVQPSEAQMTEVPEGEGLKGLVAYVAQALVDAPDEVRVTEFANESKTVIKLQVVQEDLGKVIGKKGRTAKAIRTVLSAAGLLLDKKTQLEIVE